MLPCVHLSTFDWCLFMCASASQLWEWSHYVFPLSAMFDAHGLVYAITIYVCDRFAFISSEPACSIFQPSMSGDRQSCVFTLSFHLLHAVVDQIRLLCSTTSHCPWSRDHIICVVSCLGQATLSSSVSRSVPAWVACDQLRSSSSSVSSASLNCFQWFTKSAYMIV